MCAQPRLGWQKVTYCTEKVLAARHQRRLPRSDYPVGSGEFIHKLMRCHFILISCLAHLNWISSRLSAELFTSAAAPWHDSGIDHEEFKQLPQAVFQFTWFLSSPGIHVVGVTTLFINYINVGGTSVVREQQNKRQRVINFHHNGNDKGTSAGWKNSKVFSLIEGLIKISGHFCRAQRQLLCPVCVPEAFVPIWTSQRMDLCWTHVDPRRWLRWLLNAQEWDGKLNRKEASN